MKPDRPPPARGTSRRVSPVRVRRQRTRFIIVGIIFAFIGGLVYGIGWLSYLPRYTISDVKIVGTDKVPSKLVYDYVQTQLFTGTYTFLAHNNIFLYNPHAIEREIAGFFPRIASATISRDSLLANVITVTVTERQPFALWCQPSARADGADQDCYDMDSTGFIFAQADPSETSGVDQLLIAQSDMSDASSSPAAASTTPQLQPVSPAAVRMYVFEGGLGTSTVSAEATPDTPVNPIGHRFVGAHMPGIIKLLLMLSQAGYAPTGAQVTSMQDFNVPLSSSADDGGSGFYIKASFGEDPASIVSNLQLVLSSDALAGKLDQIQYVDLRFGDRVYYKLRGAAETQPPASS